MDDAGLRMVEEIQARIAREEAMSREAFWLADAIKQNRAAYKAEMMLRAKDARERKERPVRCNSIRSFS